MIKRILLSFDVEEFDAPQEYGQRLSDETQLETSLNGLESILKLLKKLDIRATFFTTANFALHYPALMHAVARNHEIASHGFYHSSFEVSDLYKSK